MVVGVGRGGGGGEADGVVIVVGGITSWAGPLAAFGAAANEYLLPH